MVDAAGKIHLSVGEKNVALSFSLSLYICFWQVSTHLCGHIEWYMIWCVAINFLAIVDEMWFLATGPMVTVAKFFAMFSKWKTCWCIFKKYHRYEQVQFSDENRCLFFCLHFAVGCHYHYRIFRYPHGLQFGFVQVFLANHVHACSGIYHKLSFLWVYCGCGRQNPLLRRWIEWNFVFLFELIDFPGKFPRISAGTSLLSFSLLLRSILKFHSVGNALIMIYD